MGAIIVLLSIGIILSALHFLFGLVLEFLRMRNSSSFSLKKWAVCMTLTAVCSFLIFAYGVGTQLCFGRKDMTLCIGAVLEASLKLGVLIFPLIILFGMLGVITGRAIARKFKSTHRNTNK